MSRRIEQSHHPFGKGDRDQHLARRADSKTIVLKGLSPRTTDSMVRSAMATSSPKDVRVICNRESGECKGFAFVEFFSIDQAQQFYNRYENDKELQFSIDSRTICIEFCRDQEHVSKPYSSSSVETSRPGPIKCDWICEKCNCQNFARRVECYRCSSPKSTASISVSDGQPHASSEIVSTKPTDVLYVHGLSRYVTEDQVFDVFRQFAAVKSVSISKDTFGHSRGIAFIEFFSVEHAEYALRSSEKCEIQLEKGSSNIKAYFANPAFVIAAQQIPDIPAFGGIASIQASALAASAMQAAQWSTNNFVSSSNFGHQKSSTLVPKLKPTWPPCFDSHGSSYIFQIQTGLFFEPHSEYYYCPKSKLYYRNSDGLYFHFDPFTEPNFIPFYPAEPDFTDLPLTNTSSESNKTDAVENCRKPVVLSIGSQLKKAKVSSSAKRPLASVVKWASVGGMVEDAEASLTNTTTTMVKSKLTPCCLICRRQFQTKVQVLRHERESKLHAENKLKFVSSAGDFDQPYRDRASERRATQGFSTIRLSGQSLGANSSTILPHQQQQQQQPPQQQSPLFETSRDTFDNPGGELLRKMGWTGKGLGRDESGIEIPIAVNQHEKSTGLGCKTSDAPTLVYNEGADSYKQSLLRAARARYENVSSSQ